MDTLLKLWVHCIYWEKELVYEWKYIWVHATTWRKAPFVSLPTSSMTFQVQIEKSTKQSWICGRKSQAMMAQVILLLLDHFCTNRREFVVDRSKTHRVEVALTKQLELKEQLLKRPMLWLSNNDNNKVLETPGPVVHTLHYWGQDGGWIHRCQ